MKKLTLNRETIRRLTDRQLSEVAGGATTGCPRTEWQCPIDPPSDGCDTHLETCPQTMCACG